MVKPVQPSNPTGGDGNEKYNPNPKHGPGKFDADLEKAKSDRARAEIRSMAEKTRAEPPYTGKAYSDTGPRTGSNISGAFGVVTDPMERKAKPYNKAKGGVIKSASKRADGCAIRGKTRA
jgi:hypothetical protein